MAQRPPSPDQPGPPPGRRAAPPPPPAPSWRALDALYAISVACRGAGSFQAIFAVIERELTAIFTFDACYIAVCDTTQPNMFRAAYMVDQGAAEFVERMPYGALTSLLLDGRAPLLFDDLLAMRAQLGIAPDRFGDAERPSRSWMGVPLLIGQDAVGVLSVQSYEPRRYAPPDLDLLQRIGNVVGVALENVHLSQMQHELSQALAARVADRTDDLALLSALAAATVEQRPLADLLDRALGLILPHLALQAGNIRLLDPQTDELVIWAQRGLPPSYAAEVRRVPVRGTALEQVMLRNQTLAIPAGLPRQSISGARQPFEALLGVPLRIGDRTIGAMVLLGDAAHDFSADQADLARVFGNQLALAIESARLFEERERQIAELRALSQIGHAAATAHGLRTLLRRVHEALRAFMPLDAFLLIVYDRERGLIVDGIGIDEGQEYSYFKNQPMPAGTLSSWVLREGRTLHLANLPEEIGQYPGLSEYLIGSNRSAAAWLGVPLSDRAGQAIGLIGIQSYTPGAFGARDERFLTDAARHVALHVQNMRLTAEREQRIRELDAIGQIGQLVSASYDFEEMLQQVYAHLQALTGAPVFYIVICEPDTHIITHSVYIDRGAQLADNWRGRQPVPGSLTAWVLHNRRALRLDDLIAQRDDLIDMGIAADTFTPENNTRAWVGVPLIAKEGQPIGVISVQDYRPAQYSQRTVDLLSQVASHLSLGVQKVRLFEERERQLAENARLFAAEQAARRAADTLREVARVLSASFDSSEVPHLILRELRQVIPYDTASIMLLEDDQFRMALQGKPTSTEAPLHATFRLEQLNAAAQVIRQRAPLIIGDTTTASEWTPIAQEPPMRSWLGVPLLAKGRVLGVLNISAAEPHRFAARDAEVALAFASQAAVAMENARLYEESVTRVEQELEIAAQIQRNLFPRALPQVDGAELAAWIQPARETGGDFYDLLALDRDGGDLIGVIVGDASGKSIPAAMLMAVARSIARSEARNHQIPQEVMRETNRWIALDIPPRAFVALCYATVDLRRRVVALANAGQLAPLRRRADGRLEYLEPPGTTLPLGIAADTPYAAVELALDHDDLLLFYTDGIVEAQNAQRELFGFERLEAIVRAHGNLPPAALIDQIVAAVAGFGGGAPQHDDMTLVALRIG
ncbi:GAF domain-containing protein [Kouleothrix sp.]|uniref:GAF domain-containing protein n=1 Tax=Kouleothrix sp. TaxID=2779161 RepID=UPI003919BF13